MSTEFVPGQVVGRGDLDLSLVDANDNPINAAVISYALYYVDPGPPEVEVLIGSPNRIPVNPSVGTYYASLMVPPGATLGNYRIRWTFKQLVGSANQQVVMAFTVIAPGAISVLAYSSGQMMMMNRLRVLIRDNSPDRNYKFRPPEHEGNIGQYNQVFGQIWEDAELLEYLETSLDGWNSLPPFTGHNIPTIDRLVVDKPAWKTPVLWGAIASACFALSMNWINEEFSYSIGGVSLDLSRSDKYQSMKENAEQRVESFGEAKARTVKYIRGLQQPRFGVGIRSAFGPAVAKGVLSPRSFLVIPLLMFGFSVIQHVLPFLPFLI